MKRIALLLAFAGLSLSGCKNDTYCLNCQSADGSPADFMPPDDLTEPPDLVPPPDLMPPPDLTVIGPDGGPCVPTNAGIEKCDGLDNDCNGIVDDVAASKLAMDPENCGKCGSACDYTATHQTGVCTNSTCSPGTCLPGYVDNSPGVPGCEYACTPTVPATEVCDGKDNDCNGTTDDGFGYPKYNLGAANCGACGNVCNLPGAVSYCATDPTTGQGVCAVDHCVNDGTNTYRHAGAGGLNTTGCEYHCPFPSTTVTSGSHDCDDTTCSFPAEVCNGIDDDCNRTNDDNPTDVGPTFACGSKCPMGSVANCVGECKAGSMACVSGVKVCQGSVGPTVELCDAKDNDCNGMTDDAPQDSWVNQACCPTGKTSDCQNTGTGSRCSTGVYQCQLGLKSCSGGVSKTPEVCNAADDDCNGTTDDVPGVGTACTGGGTNTTGSCTAAFSCNGGVPGPGPNQLTCKQVIAPKAETCNLLDDDCDGSTDNGNPGGGVACGQNCPGGTTGGCVGACMAGTTVCSSGAIVCQNSTGPAAETCDSKDNDCNGSTDDVPGINSACSDPANGILNTGRCVAKLHCTGTPGPGVNGLTCTQIVAKLPKELCNGVDDDCNGMTDEPANMVDPAVGIACGQNCPGGNVANCVGTCMAGTSQCSNGAVICVGSTGPALEFCNNKDDNCDGATDNNVADSWIGQGCCPTGNPSDCANAGGSTHCVMGAFTCTGGAKVCNGGVAKGVEVCDGIDNDCNGVTDDVPGIGQACTGGGTNTTGRCTASWACTGVAGPGPSGLTCQQVLGPVAETCNGVDDNCNGTTDEGNPGGGAACGKNCPGGLVANCKGACVAGTTACTNGAIVCNGSTGPTAEVCNNIDDNCDGTTDNAITDPWAGQACCSTGNNADCTNTGTGTRCHTSTYTCVTGARTCAGSAAKSSEVCDNVDNDCNGPVDDVSGVGSPCNTGGVNTTGKCTANYTCNGGVPGPGPNQLTCKQTVAPSAELCNGIDDDCNGATDDNATDVGAAFPCYQQCPGGVPAGCKGECHAGQLACSSGVKTCSTPPGVIGADTCDGKDNDCNGTTDDGFGFPLYNTDPTHCGTCATTCNLTHAVNGCHSDATIDASNKGVCFVVACANTPSNGYNYVPATCGGTTPTRDGPAGVGCNYACPVWPATASEVCDGKDNDCNGATDELKTACYVNGLVPPAICANKGVCMGQTIPVNCQGAAGWKCNYSGVPNIDLVSGNLAPAENNGPFCDSLDNNCNGTTDLDGFPTKGNACTAGVGVCQNSGTLGCNSPTNTALVCSVVASPNNAVDELCDGKDNNCDGNTDERTPTGTPTCFNGGSHTCLGYKDPMVQIGATGKYVYSFEASRPGATSLSPGGNQSRACSVSGVLPWATVTETQAAAACAAVKDSLGNPMRLCDATEWQQACEGPGGAAASKWSESAAPATYVSGVCNDVNRANPDAVWATATTGPAGAPLCYTDWVAAGKIYDLSGNVEEWTKTTVVSGGTTYFKIRGGSYTSPQGGTTCEFDFNIAQAGFANGDVGFRCCSDAAP